MCGRYYLTRSVREIAEVTHAEALPEALAERAEDEPTPSYRPCYNVAPTRYQPILRIDPSSGKRALCLMVRLFLMCARGALEKKKENKTEMPLLLLRDDHTDAESDCLLLATLLRDGALFRAGTKHALM